MIPRQASSQEPVPAHAAAATSHQPCSTSWIPTRFTILPLANAVCYHTMDIDGHAHRLERAASVRARQVRPGSRRLLPVRSRRHPPGRRPSPAISSDGPAAGRSCREGRSLRAPDGIAWEFTGPGRRVQRSSWTTSTVPLTSRGERSGTLEELQRCRAASPFGDGQGLPVASTLEGSRRRSRHPPPPDQCLGTPFQRIAANAPAWRPRPGVLAEQGLESFPAEHGARRER